MRLLVGLRTMLDPRGTTKITFLKLDVAVRSWIVNRPLSTKKKSSVSSYSWV